eukprot:TRINITY_DN1100_c0_g1_i1.p1 TRINITY_DN1100_c0_g1~~TRINITY_DN1100_c0_g1_i1.p1  ORF type:complete len:455 (-),score=149.71 TRINITY_DN1100_c0_g1_i1:22-1278(-)
MVIDESDSLDFSSDEMSDDQTPTVTQITSDGGVVKEIITQGRGSATPAAGASVKMHYTGTLEDGTQFDSSVERGTPFEFVVGEGNVIKGWDLVVPTMKKGEKAKVTLRSDYAYGDTGAGENIPPGATLIFEMELIEFENEKDLTKEKSGGVMKRVIKSGEGFQTPTYESEVVVSYICKSKETEEVLFSVDNEIYTIDFDSLPSGLQLAIESMKKGEESVFTIAPDYAFGEEGSSSVPPNTTVVYEVTLHNLERAKDPYTFKSFDEKMEQALLRKEAGNEFFKRQKLLPAQKKYERAIKFLDNQTKFDDEQKKEAENFKLSCHLNLSLVFFKIGDMKKSLKSANDALKIEKNNVKGLYRRSVAHFEQGNWDEARKDIKTLLAIDPENGAAKKVLAQIKRKVEAYKKKQKSMYSNIFSKV